MNGNLRFCCFVGACFGVLSSIACGQSPAPLRQNAAWDGLADAPIKACRPMNRQGTIQKNQAIAEVPPAPEPDLSLPKSVETPPGVTAVPLEFTAGIHPYYVTSGEDSYFFSECRTCGRNHCRCTYAPLGDSLIAAFGRQAYSGSVQMMTLYNYDFRDTALTMRGVHQLQKFVDRMAVTPGPIKIQATGIPGCDEARRANVVQLLSGWGLPEADGLVITTRTERGREAVESLETAEGLLQQIRARGVTIRPEGSASFSGNAIFGR